MADTVQSIGLGTILVIAAATGCSSVELPDQGSYRLTLHDIEVSQSGNSPAYSEGLPIRIDLRKDGDGYRYVSAPHFGPVGAGEAELDGDELTLENVEVRSESWSRIVLELDDDDGITGEGTATGSQYVTYVDYAQSYTMSGSATLGPDEAAPVVRLTPEDTSTAQLPWTAFYAYLSEPVPPDEAAAHLQAETASGEPIAVVAAPWLPEGEGPQLAGTVQVNVTLPWSTVDGQTVTLRALPGLADPSGNQSVAQEKTYPLIALGDPQAAFTFETTIGGHSWGEVSLAPCDGLGCLSLGTFEINDCDAEADRGMAGRLSASGASEVVVRYRVSTPLASSLESHFGLTVVTLGGSASSAWAQIGPSDLLEQDGLWRTDWLELTASTSGSSEMGFAVYAGPGFCNIHGGPGIQEVTVEVDGVEAR